MCKSSVESRRVLTRSSSSTDKALNPTIGKPRVAKSKTIAQKSIQDVDKNISREKLDHYLTELHKAFKKLNNKNPSTTNRAQEYILEKTCERCDNVHCDELLLLCDICDDAYHTFCLTPALPGLPDEDEEWICPVCIEQKAKKEQREREEKLALLGRQTPSNKRQSILDEHFHIQERDAKTCYGCEELISEKPASPVKEVQKGKRTPNPVKIRTKEICIKCQHYFHPDCFNKKKTAILCFTCEERVHEVLPKSEKKILNFFGVKSLKRDFGNSAFKKSLTMDGSEILPSSSIGDSVVSKLKSKTKKSKTTRKATSRRTVFKLPKASKDPQKVLRQKMSLAFGLLTKNIAFDDDLYYGNPECPETANDTCLEPNLQKMDKATIAIFKEFKEMTRGGNYPPVMVEEDKNQGFIVRADDDIPGYTLITEYVGDVDYARNRVFDKNDSIMDLLRTPHSTTTLVICPEQRGNLARFLSGINNSDKNAKRFKQNVKSVRFNVEGRARVFLYAARTIKQGEVLYYDYNEGGFDEYPTEDFV